MIIPHFSNYPLVSQKRADYELLKQAIELINLNKNKKKESLIKFVNIRASMNNGLSPLLKENFIEVVPIERPRVETVNNINPNWLSGFSSGEGCFFIKIKQSKSHKLGYQVSLMFKLSQHVRYENLMTSFIEYLGTGRLYKEGAISHFQVENFSHIINNIIPFFR